MTKPAELSRMVLAREVARQLGLSLDMLLAQSERGQFAPAYRIGGRIYYKLHEAAEAIERCRIDGNRISARLKFAASRSRPRPRAGTDPAHGSTAPASGGHCAP